MKRCLFIFNPHTGGGRLKPKLMEILCMLADAGYEMLVCPTTAAGDACRYAEAHGAESDLAVCVGGDGTLNEMVNGLMPLAKRPLIGYIPGGTTNDFASSLLLPKTNLVQAAERIVHPKKIFPFDVGSLNDRAFTYVAAFGAFADVSYSTPQSFKNLFGYFAYLVEGVQRLPNLPSFRAKVTGDEGELEDEFLFGMIANSTSVGGFHFTDKSSIRLDDGVFEMLLLRRPQSLAQLGELSGALLSRNVQSPWLAVQRTRNAEIISEVPIPWTLDGEFGGEQTDSKITVHHRALRICI